jgi:tetratricopeptide (TPR) repeat protein
VRTGLGLRAPSSDQGRSSMAKDAKPSAKEASAQPPAEPPRASLLRRGLDLLRWTVGTRARMGVTLGTAILAMVGLAAGIVWALRSSTRPPLVQRLALVFKTFDSGDMRQARRLAADLVSDPTVGYEEQGGAYYILGAVTAYEADQQINLAKRRLLDLVASRYLDEARNRGIPAERQRDGLVLLGRALHDAGRYARSIPILREALQADGQPDPRLYALLADSYLSVKPPRFAEALDNNRLYLASGALSPREQDEANLIEGRIQLAQRDYPAAAAAASQVKDTSSLYPEATVLRGRILLEMLRQPSGQQPPEADSRVTALVNELRQLLAREGLAPAVVAQCQLLLGLAYQQQGNIEATQTQLDHTRRAFFGFPEGLAATVFFADLILPTDPLEAVALYKRALSQAGTEDTFDNIWLPTDQLQRRLEKAIDSLIAARQFDVALDLASSMAPLFPRAVALARQAETNRAWARALEETSRTEKTPQAGVTAAEARQEWRQAGAAQRQLADLRVATRYYLDDLARAADDFRRGQGYEQAVAVYRDLLHQNPPQGHPEALIGLGEALLALGKTEEALQALDSCRESYPNHPASYRARLLASLTLQEKGKLAEAKELLVDNLYRFSLAPQSSEWRDSLFALGALLYREALDLESRSRLAGVDRLDNESKRAGLALLEQSHSTFDEAVRTLTEAVQRYPAAPQTVEARYRIAEAHRHSAKWPRKRLNTVSIETSKAALGRQMQEQLQAAVADYNALITRLSEQPDANRTPTDAAILRNCYFGRADALFDLGRYDEAIEAYSAATNRYQHDPESLEAYVQIASCYRRLDRLSEARGTLEQARVVLQRIRPDADFTKTTRLARQDWVLLLNWLRTL